MREQQQQTGQLVTRPKGARLKGIGLRQVLRACESGELAVYEVGGWPRISLDELDAWVESKKRKVRLPDPR